MPNIEVTERNLLVLKKILDCKKILVVGDIMLDIYYHGMIERISPEAPVPVFRTGTTTYRLGGAANVAVNMAANGQLVFVLSIIGKDKNGETLKSLFEANGIHTEYLLETERPTTTKCRLLAGNNQQVLRMDSEEVKEIEESLQKKLFESFEQCIEAFDFVIFSDYQKGFFSYDFTRKLIDTANQRGVRVLADVKDPRAEKYKGAYLIKPNRKELGILTNLPVETEQEVIDASKFLCEKCDCNYVLTTCGADGMLLVGKEGEQKQLKTTAKEVFDVTGAGDTVIAYLAICLANKMHMEQAMILANYAAGLQVSKTGTSVIRIEEVEKEARDWNKQNRDFKADTIHKRLEIDELKIIREQNKEKKIVFTNGCFDLLHIGHIRYLKEAAELGDLLIVGLNSDDSVRRLKGSERPINCQEERLEVLAALEFVDYVVIFEEDTPLQAIKKCQPDVLVKGGDYQLENIVGKEVVEKMGGSVKILPFIEGKSTTKLIQKISVKM